MARISAVFAGEERAMRQVLLRLGYIERTGEDPCVILRERLGARYDKHRGPLLVG